MSRSTSRRCSALRAMTARTFSAVLRPPRPALFPGTPPRPAAVVLTAQPLQFRVRFPCRPWGRPRTAFWFGTQSFFAFVPVLPRPLLDQQRRGQPQLFRKGAFGLTCAEPLHSIKFELKREHRSGWLSHQRRTSAYPPPTIQPLDGIPTYSESGRYRPITPTPF